MNKAVFLDRDGVINELIYNPNTGEHESPHDKEDLIIYPYVVNCLKKLQENGYYLFLISNQPSYAKGKTTLENIKDIHDKLHEHLTQNKIYFKDYFYCYHHPDGIVSEYTKVCMCRKPNNYFVKKAQQEFDIDIDRSFLVGDCDSDIECGKKSGLTTLLVETPNSTIKRGKSRPDYLVDNLKEAINIILTKKEELT